MPTSEMLHQTTNDVPRTGVLIVGAGPTGLTLAIELARRGVRFRLIDREPTRPVTSRALGVQPRTVEILRIMGLPAASLVPSLQTSGVEYWEGPHMVASISEFAPLIVEQTTTERVLEQRLALLGGQIELGTELTDLNIEPEGVAATVRHAGGTSVIMSRYLVGADGARSTVRRLAGITFTGEAYPEDFILADVDLNWPLSHDRGRVWIGDDAVLAAVPLPAENRWRLILSLPEHVIAAGGEPQPELAARAMQALRKRSEIPARMIAEPIWASHFHIQRRLAARFREGPIFLAGDAAHVHSPVGGQGMNIGMQDAFNLGWKLALAVRNQAAPGLLDTYGAERRPVAEDVLRGTDLATQLVLGQNPLARAVRQVAVPLMDKLPPVRRRLAYSLSELGIAYSHSPLSVDARSSPGLEAGDRVPDVTLRTATGGSPLTLFDLIAQGWLLLLFPGDRPTPARLAALRELARETDRTTGNLVQCYLVLQEAVEHESEAPVLLDQNRELSRTFGARDGLATLVRPDGYLGYRGGPEQRLALASYLARTYAMRVRGLEYLPTHP